MMRRLRSDEGGWAIVTSVVLMAVMLGSSLTMLTLLDSQTKESQVQRTRESSLNLSEEVLNDQVLMLRNDWPSAAAAYNPCTQATAGPRCPSPEALPGLQGRADTAADAAWTSRVMDNVRPEAGCADNNPATACDPTQSFYSDATHATAPGYDANGDGVLWVRSEATARGKTRRLLALVRAGEQVENILRAPVISGKLEFANNGSSKDFINTGSTGVVYVRCDSAVVATEACLGYGRQGNRDTKEEIVADFESAVTPARWVDNFSQQKAMDAAALERVRQTAIRNGTYYTSCAQIPTIAGKIVWLERISCSFQGNGSFNSPEQPGFLVVNGGTLSLRGTLDFYGPIYAPNPDNTSEVAVDMGGTSSVIGGVIVDGAGKLIVGSSGKGQVTFDEASFDAVRTMSPANITQGSFRELPAPTATSG